MMMAGGIIILLVSLILASTWVTDQQVRKVLIEQGKQATLNLSRNSTLALLYDSTENAEMAIQATLSFPGVRAVHIYRADADLFYSSEANLQNDSLNTRMNTRINLTSINITDKPQIFNEDDNHWHFLAPVLIEPDNPSLQEQLFNILPGEAEKTIGYVLVTSSKESLKTIGNDILLSNAIIALIIGFLLILVSQRAIKRLTQPLYLISDVMKKTEQGEYAPHIDAKGTLEVHHIAEAYNRMISALAERDEKLREQNTHLEKQAVHDHLTGLINRIGFEQALKLAIGECKTMETQHALCYMDLDKFKIVNDSCGHNAGDELLQNVSKIFKQHIRKDSDSLARVGGDEFALILKNCSIEKAQTIGESICKDIENYRFHWNGNVFSIGVSIGITQLDNTAASLRDVISKVDSACYIAKERGRGQIHVIHPDDEDLKNLGRETKIANKIIDYLENNKFEIFCQPIKHLSNKNSESQQYEILLRMKDEDGRNIPPGKFISSAERYNLITRLDHWVLSQTLMQLSNNSHFIHTPGMCTINISADSLNDDTFSHFINQQLNDKNINPGLICFEINEIAAISNISNTINFVQNIHKLGCRVMLDNFLSSSSSFSHIKNMNIDYLKINGDLFKDFTHNPISHAMVKSINEIAHILNIETIAEHIETDESLKEATSMGIDYAQGYIIGRPAPLIDTIRQAGDV